MALYDVNDKVRENIFAIMKRAHLTGEEIPVFLEIERALSTPINPNLGAEVERLEKAINEKG